MLRRGSGRARALRALGLDPTPAERRRDLREEAARKRVEAPDPERAGRRVQELSRVADRLAELQRRVDEVVRRSVERVTGHPAFQQEVKRIERTMQALEARIGRLRGNDGDEAEVPPPAPAATNRVPTNHANEG